MLFKTQMQKAELLTISNTGWLQAQYNGVLYQEKVDKFVDWLGLDGAVNAKRFFDALSILDPTYEVFIDNDTLVLVDSNLEYRLPIENPDELITLKMSQVWQPIDLQDLNVLNAFVTQDYPAFFFKNNYIEVIHPSMIVRTLNSIPIQGIFSAAVFPTQGFPEYTTTKHGLWIRYTSNARILLGRLDQKPMDTDSYFMEDVSCLPIPQNVKTYWQRCKEALFIREGLLLDNQILIDDIKGIGKYDGTLLGRVIRNCTHWAMDSELMYFKNENIIGVLENVEYS